MRAHRQAHPISRRCPEGPRFHDREARLCAPNSIVGLQRTSLHDERAAVDELEARDRPVQALDGNHRALLARVELEGLAGAGVRGDAPERIGPTTTAIERFFERATAGGKETREIVHVEDRCTRSSAWHRGLGASCRLQLGEKPVSQAVMDE